ncbi:MAG: hypothetical protein F4187_10155 [Gemmatimonadetes bacterium]|uniref:Uncharacterized protein n=1 Tax=Boseongicola sp. SB0664_bin_43 TaxID=2604844 RepID=A0A6B0XXQ2_9RHOB|nr:hypothetical protein [Boseongicola sp. SB0664_bin_43]MYG82085.1 hypothetical protein [Gemmatimonadota bacterium]MYK33155.1 hypothetical protein [Boseongicola sp. SB0670_bin_30]
MTDGPEIRRRPPDSASESGDSGPDFPWSLPGVPADALVWPVTGTRQEGWRSLFGRLRRPVSGEGPKDSPKSAVPVNLRPWTWEILPHVSEARDGSHLERLMDRVAWHATLPDARYVLLAERRRRREESLVARALVRFAAAFAGKPPGSPPWLAECRRGDEP